MSSGSAISSPEFTVDAADHRYRLGSRRLLSVTDALVGAGIIKYGTKDEMLRARERGKAVHVATHYHDEGDLDEGSLKPISEAIGEPIEPYLEAWKRFRMQTGFCPTKIEFPRYHGLWLYAGTIDRIGMMPDGRTVLLDIKTGNIPDWVDLQTAAYEMLVPEMRVCRMAVALRSNGNFVLQHYANPNDGQEFLAILTTYRRLYRGRFHDEG